MSPKTESVLRLDTIREFEASLRVSISDYLQEFRDIIGALEEENARLRQQLNDKEKGNNGTS